MIVCLVWIKIIRKHFQFVIYVHNCTIHGMRTSVRQHAADKCGISVFGRQRGRAIWVKGRRNKRQIEWEKQQSLLSRKCWNYWITRAMTGIRHRAVETGETWRENMCSDCELVKWSEREREQERKWRSEKERRELRIKRGSVVCVYVNSLSEFVPNLMSAIAHIPT